MAYKDPSGKICAKLSIELKGKLNQLAEDRNVTMTDLVLMEIRAILKEKGYPTI